MSVHLDAEGNISQWHRLREEEPFTAWVGGELKTNCSYRQLLSLEVEKIIITVVGKDTTGIIARVCSYLAESKINILDISQTIVQGYFNMMMIADMEACSKDFLTIANDLESVGSELGVQVKCQKEAIFEKMHRL